MTLVHVSAAPPPVYSVAAKRRRALPLVLAVPYAAWLCCLGAPAAFFDR